MSIFKQIFKISHIFIVLLCLVQAGEGKDKMETTREHKYTNKLASENSPYLLSHAHNPVDWYQWGEEALQKARELDRPIFLSIGYAACHWCHVMERESFENEAVAAILNENYISIKVDREQRPDLDNIYMAFTTALTGHGGWPMSVFLTPDLKPFYAGTYFPPEDAYGRPGFGTLITEIARAYQENKAKIIASSDKIFSQLNARLNRSRDESALDRAMLGTAANGLMRNFDHTYGGFGGAPKFPHSMELSLFLRHYLRTGETSYFEAARTALVNMARGGIYDHLGGGFARYAVDEKWLVPHFEKMLYDNALLVETYAEAYQLTGDEFYRKVVRETLDFILREMTDRTGGFYSALDADSEGEEGKFYVWTKNEIEAVLGADAPDFMRFFNVSNEGNFEGKNILNITAESARIRTAVDTVEFDKKIAAGKEKLLAERARRVRPLTDDKILTSWNGLALAAFCKGYQITGEKKYLEAALKNAAFVTGELLDGDALTHAYRGGKSSPGRFLEDYAYYIKGLLDLYESDPSENNHRWLEFADRLAAKVLELFVDDDGVFYLRPAGREDLIVRPRDENDGAVPAPGSVMVYNLLKLDRLTESKSYAASAEKALKALSGQLKSYPTSMTSALFALDYLLNDKIEIVVVGKGELRHRMLDEIYKKFIPNKVVAVSRDGGNAQPLFEGRTAAGDGVMVYICRNSVCKLPVSTVAELKKSLKEI